MHLFLLITLFYVQTARATPVGPLHDRPGNVLNAKDWVGEIVFPREPSLKLRHGDRIVDDYDINRPHVIGVSDDKLRLQGVKYKEGSVTVREVVKLADAPAYFTERINQEPSRATWYWYRGSAWRRQGKLDNALQDLNQAIKLNSDTASWWIARSVILILKHDYDKAMADCNEALRINPAIAMAYNNRGLCWDGKREYDKAITDFNEALRRDPKLAYAYCNCGRTWRAKGDLDKALADINEALRLDSTYVVAFQNRIEIWKLKGDDDKALVDYTELLRLNPKQASIFVSRGHLWLKKGEYDKAIADFENAERLNPQMVFISGPRSIARRKKGMYKEALADCQEAMRQNANSPSNLVAYTWLLASCPDAQFRDGKKAVELATKACQLTNWKMPQAISALAAAYAEANDFERAVKYQKQALTFSEFKKEYGVVANQQLAGYEKKQPYREEPR